MAAAGSVQQQQGRGAMFAAACGALSRYVKAAAVVETRPVAVMLPLMPGADVPAPEAGPAQQLTISYGGRVVVLDDVPAGKAAELVRAAAAAQAAPRVLREGDLPMARKASLQRFMEKRKGRALQPPGRRRVVVPGPSRARALIRRTSSFPC